MKKNLFKVAIAMLLLAGCAKNQTQPEFSSEISADKQKITNADLLATATIDAGTVQQTIKGFGGANIVAWTAPDFCTSP